MKAQTLLKLAEATQLLEEVADRMRFDQTEVLKADDHVDAIVHFNQGRLAQEKIKQARKSIEEMVDAMSHQFIPEIVTRLRQRTGEKPPFYIENVGRVSVAYRWAASIAEGQKEAAFDWLRTTGNDGIIQETVNSQTLAAFAKEYVSDKGKDLPGEFFKVAQNPYTSITKV